MLGTASHYDDQENSLKPPKDIHIASIGPAI